MIRSDSRPTYRKGKPTASWKLQRRRNLPDEPPGSIVASGPLPCTYPGVSVQLVSIDSHLPAPGKMIYGTDSRASFSTRGTRPGRLHALCRDVQGMSRAEPPAPILAQGGEARGYSFIRSKVTLSRTVAVAVRIDLEGFRARSQQERISRPTPMQGRGRLSGCTPRR